MKRVVIDIETNGFLSTGLDYSSLPFKLKPSYRLWCIVLRDIDSEKVISLALQDCTKENLKKALEECEELVGHNIVAFDLPILYLLGVLDYEIAYPKQKCKVFGKDTLITDTLIWSKLLDPDRLGGHSLDDWGKRLGNHKQDFTDFNNYSQEMLTYCIQDTGVNKDLYFRLQSEKGEHSWNKAYEMELKLVDLTLKQELFGFSFDVKKAEQNLQKLNQLMQERAERVNPFLPKKRLTTLKLKEFTPPKNQFKMNGDISVHLQNFANKHNAEIDKERRLFIWNGKELPLPLVDPIETHETASIEDIDVVKGYLLSLGWEPTEVKERDLVKNTDKSLKNEQEIVQAIDRYVKQTEKSVFKELREEIMACPTKDMKEYLLSRINGTKPIYVPTTPKLQVGIEKTICPNLEQIEDKVSLVKDVCEYFTYRHRKNAIAGGEVDEDGEPITGYLSAVREDGRVPTPADTLGANTSRYRHKIVCNVPRNTSLFGEEMRSMFRSGKDFYQLGFDFSSLEARIQGHYCLPYTQGKELSESLVAEKPNDLHSKTAKKLGIDRASAKSVNYACMYGAQAKKLAKMLKVSQKEGERIFELYWDSVIALKELKEKLEKHWESNNKQWIQGIDGRKVRTRSKHSLINVLFQSGGAILAKWSIVYMSQLMQEKGLLGNVFLHSNKDVKAWLMIVMHDEAQIAVHPSLLNVKLFATEEEAKQALQEGCSAIGHGSKGYYVAYKTSPVECIEEGIKKACKENNFRLDLGYEWVTGLHWGQCH